MIRTFLAAAAALGIASGQQISGELKPWTMEARRTGSRMGCIDTSRT
jgi:hypothetical protein